MVRQTPRMSARVVNAIRNLCDVHGSSSKQILNYIMAQDDIPTDTSSVQKQIWGALKRGVAYGILKKSNGHYTLSTEPDIDRMETLFAPTEKRGRARRRRQGRRRRRKSRSRRRRRSRRGRGKKRRRSRRRRSRSRRRRSRVRRRPSSTGAGRKPRICDYCRSLAKKAQEDELNRSNSSQELLEDQTFQEHQQEHDEGRRSKSRQRDRTRSRSIVNRDAGGVDRSIDE